MTAYLAVVPFSGSLLDLVRMSLCSCIQMIEELLKLLVMNEAITYLYRSERVRYPVPFRGFGLIHPIHYSIDIVL